MIQIQAFYINNKPVDCYLLYVPSDTPKFEDEYKLFGFNAVQLLEAFDLLTIDRNAYPYMQAEQISLQCVCYYGYEKLHKVSSHPAHALYLVDLGAIAQLLSLQSDLKECFFNIFNPIHSYLESYLEGMQRFYSKEVQFVTQPDGTKKIVGTPSFAQINRRVSILLLNSSAEVEGAGKLGYWLGIPWMEPDNKEYLTEQQLAAACRKITRKPFSKDKVRDRLIKAGMLISEVRKLKTYYELTEMGKGYSVESSARKWHVSVLRMLIEI